MAWKKWGNFFKDIAKYFNSETWSDAKPSKNFNTYYYFLASHFSGYSTDESEIEKRAVYAQEGEKAENHAEWLQQAFAIVSKITHPNLYEIYKANKTDINLTNLAQAIVRAMPELEGDDNVI